MAPLLLPIPPQDDLAARTDGEGFVLSEPPPAVVPPMTRADYGGTASEWARGLGAVDRTPDQIASEREAYVRQTGLPAPANPEPWDYATATPAWRPPGGGQAIPPTSEQIAALRAAYTKQTGMPAPASPEPWDYAEATPAWQPPDLAKINALRGAAGLEPVAVRATAPPGMAAPVPEAPVVPALVARTDIDTSASMGRGTPGVEWRPEAPAAPAPPPGDTGGAGGAPPVPLRSAGVGGATAASPVVPPEGRSGVTVPNVAAGEKVDASQVVQAPERTVAAGGRPGAVDTGRYNASAGNEAALLNEKYLAELNRGPTSWGASPEREQRQHVTLQQQVGADPSIIAEQKAIETGPGDLVRDELAAKPPPPARYEPKQILQLFQPSPESVAAFERANGRKLTEKDRIGWATALAADLSAKGLSPSSAAATRNPSVSVVPLDDESRQRVIDSLEKPNIEARAKWDREEAARLESLRGAVKATAAQNGTPEGGLVDLEKRGKIIDRGIAEEEAATHLQLAKIHEDSAKQQEADYRAKLEEKTPGAIGGFLSGIAQIMGATASGINGRPNAALAVLLDQDARRIAKFSESTAQRLGLEGARLKQVEEELLAKKSLGLGAQQQLSADKMLAEVRLRRAKNDEERSALARGAKSTASAVIPARAAGSGGGTSLDKLIAIAKQRRELEKEGVEVGSKAAESGAKSISERGVLNGVTYHLGNVTSPSEGAKARSQLGSLDKMEQTLKLLEEQAKAYGTRTWNPGRFENLVQEFTYDASNAKDQGVVRDPEMQAKLKSLGSWTGGQDVINDMRKITNISRRALTTQLGAVPVK